MSNPLQGKPPLTLTFAELEAAVAPLLAVDAWARSTLIDLWTKGAPTPQSVYGSPNEKRIVFPGQLYNWLADVMIRKSIQLDAGSIYKNLR